MKNERVWGRRISCLNFADSVVTLADKTVAVQRMLQTLKHKIKKYEMKINEKNEINWSKLRTQYESQYIGGRIKQ